MYNTTSNNYDGVSASRNHMRPDESKAFRSGGGRGQESGGRVRVGREVLPEEDTVRGG